MEINEVFSGVNQDNSLMQVDYNYAGQSNAEIERLQKERQRKRALFRYTNPIQYAKMYPNRLIIPIVLILIYFGTKKKLFIGGAIAMYILQD